jgi:L-fuculose-phosphate aldolase
MRYIAEREAVCRTAVEMEDRGLTIGTSGNVSMRVPEGALITPSTIPYKQIMPEDLNLMDLEGNVLEGDKMPSVEHKVHLACYKFREDVQAVVHAHPTIASAFASARVPLPAFLDEFGVYVGDEVRVADYAISGTPDIAENLVKALGTTANAAFLASHGMVAVGRDLEAAMMVARHVERGALIYIVTKFLGGAVDLPEDARTLFGQVFEYFRTRELP